jgi:hypothetical protein
MSFPRSFIKESRLVARRTGPGVQFSASFSVRLAPAGGLRVLRLPLKSVPTEMPVTGVRILSLA